MSYEQSNFVEINTDLFKNETKTSKRYHEYREAWKMNPLTGHVAPFPLNVDIELTNMCNLKCPYCARTNGRWGDNGYGYMKKELVEKILDELGDNGCYCAKFNLRGEPLLHKDIIEIMEYTSKTNLIEYYFNTNGTLLTEDNMRAFIRIGLPRISISVAGWNKETYEESQCGADYNLIRESIKRFMALKKELNSEVPRIRLQIVLTKEVLDNMERVEKTWGSLGDEFGGIVYREELKKESDSAGKICKEFKCNFLWQRIVVLWNGDVFPCLFHGVKQNADIYLGNAYESSIAELWNSQKANEIRQKHRDGISHCVDSCRNCSYRDTEIERIIADVK